VGLYCSFARASVVATMAAAAGIGLDDLFASMVERAREG
jgi:D-alanine-D-alanine ligase